MSTKLFLVRSLPGGGKTTLAKELCKRFNCTMYAADDYFMVRGKYVFDGSKLGEAHSQCFTKTKVDLINGQSVVVHNTFTTYGELKPYLQLIDEVGCEYSILEPPTAWRDNPDECFKMNTHGVPLESIIKMKNRWQDTKEVLGLWQKDRNLLKSKT